MEATNKAAEAINKVEEATKMDKAEAIEVTDPQPTECSAFRENSLQELVNYQEPEIMSTDTSSTNSSYNNIQPTVPNIMKLKNNMLKVNTMKKSTKKKLMVGINF